MRQIPSLLSLEQHTHDAIARFGNKITKRKQYYDHFYKVLFASFDQVLQEEENTCIGCGHKFLGKSIGPHYKNSKKCADIKRLKEGRKETPKVQKVERSERSRPLREPLTKLENQEQPCASSQAKMKQQQVQKEQKQEGVQSSAYDQLNEYFESF